MEPVLIKKLYWKDSREMIKAVNGELLTFLDPLMPHFAKSHQDYLYNINYRFGDYVIRNNKMAILPKEPKDGQRGKQVLLFEGDGDQTELLAQFQANTATTKGHPLTLVTKNYIEVFREQASLYTIGAGANKSYCYPLNVINAGELFGVFESINLMFKYDDLYIGSWDATAGKHCLVSILPDKFRSDFYNGPYTSIFGSNATDIFLGFNHVANELINNDPFTETLLFPEFYYMPSETDDHAIGCLKRLLREHIFRMGWQQQTKDITSELDDHQLLKFFNTKDMHFVIPISKHVDNILQGKAFLLKPIDRHDGLLFETQQELMRRFKNTKVGKNLNAIDYNTPLFFHYDKITGANNWGFEMAHSPSSPNIYPPGKMEQLRIMVYKTIMLSNKLKQFLQREREITIDLEFYVVKASQNDKATLIQDFIDKKLLLKLKGDYPELQKIHCTDTPWYFNSLLYIEKHED